MKTRIFIIAAIFCCGINSAGAGEKIFVAESFSNQIDEIDPTSANFAVKKVNVGLTPQDIKLTPDGKTLFSANYLSHDLTEIDTQSLSVRRHINLSCSPSALAISPDGETGYALCRNTGKVLYLDLPSATETAALSVTFPYGLAITPDGQKAYISRSMFSRSVDVVDLPLRKITSTITVGRSPQGIIVGPSGESAYVANAGSATVSIIDTKSNTVRRTVSVGNGPCTVAVDSGETILFVANKTDATVSVVDLNLSKSIKTIPVGVAPQGLALSATQPRLYVANFASNTISVIDTEKHQLIATIPVTNGPQALAVAPPMDTTPPEVRLSVSQEILWPPNHKLVPVSVQIEVADDQDLHPIVQLLNITSNEPCSSLSEKVQASSPESANPTTCNDIVNATFGTADSSFLLRAERFGYSEAGRIYTISYKVTDAAGNATIANTSVQIPLNFSEKQD